MLNTKKTNMVINILLFIRSFAIILAFLYLGKGVSYLIGWPIPGSVIGLISLFSALSLRLIPLNFVLPAGQFLLKYMILFFVPVGVGLINHGELFATHWIAIVVSAGVSTIVILLSVGWSYQRINQ
jgi:holin-like protein